MYIKKAARRPGKSAQNILDSIRRIVKALRVSSKLAEKHLGISGAQLFVLQKLGDGSTLSINELARRTLTHQSSVSVVVSRLIERGLVLHRSSENDARKMDISLSAKGHSFLKKAHPAAQEKLITAICKLSAGQSAALSDLLRALVTKAGLADDRPQLFFENEEE
ncbi:MAG: MarR family transcriptional regulator [uncultured bacterium]|nr:MAG: MarR family transcriptional regulator [uncultured bacterium]